MVLKPPHPYPSPGRRGRKEQPFLKKGEGKIVATPPARGVLEGKLDGEKRWQKSFSRREKDKG